MCARKTVSRAAGALALAAVVAACDKSPTEPTEPPPAAVTSVAITGSAELSEGSTSQLTATATLSDGSTQNVTNQATWTSSNTMVASVSGTGLVSALQTGTADISAVYSAQTGRRTLQISPARFSVTLTAQSVTALATCDDVTQGLTSGEFATRVLAITPDGSQSTVSQTTGYPGDPSGPRGHNLAVGESASINVTREFTLDGAAGQFLRVQFNATEWDEQIVIIPPSIRWIHDSRLSNAATSRTHSYANGTFGSLGPNALTLGNSSCGIRLNYTISAVKQ
jgi:hypothetical protein